MKILYLDINVIYHNPTRNNIPFLLKEIGELYIFGLGYQPRYILEKGLKTFYELNAPFDFVVTNEHIIFGGQNLDRVDYCKGYENNYFIQFDLKEIKKYIKEQFDFFKLYDGNKLIFLLESDYYNFQKKQIDNLFSCDAYIAGWGGGYDC